MRAFLTLAAGALAIGFWVYAVVDCAVTDSRRVRGITKPVWLLIVILLNVIGGVLWFIIGKDRANPNLERIRFRAPEDDPAFMHQVEGQMGQDARIKDLERQIAELDDDSKES